MSEIVLPEYSPFDHKPRFTAYAEHETDVSRRIADLLSNSGPQPIEIDISEDQILLSREEISRLWGIFPASARERAVPNPPIIKSDTPRWFAVGSSPTEVIITEESAEAISPTAHGLAHRATDTGVITIHQIPENGFSKEVHRLVRAGVVVP